MFDPMACYGEFLNTKTIESTRDTLIQVTGVKRQMENECTPAWTPPTPQIAPVFMSNAAVPIRLPPSLADAVAPSAVCGGFPQEHAGVLREEGGVREFIKSLRTAHSKSEAVTCKMHKS